MNRGFAGAIAAIALSMVGLTAIPAAADATTVTVGSAQSVGSSIQVTGSITFGSDLTGPVEVTSDATGDAVANGIGLDLLKGTIATNVGTKRLTFALNTADGLPSPFSGAPPASGFQWPIAADGQDLTRWLGAGTGGSGGLQTGNWTGLCHNQTQTGGWDCSAAVTGSVTTTGVTWQIPFASLPPGVGYGSTIDGGSILCAIPCSFHWNWGVVGALTPIDTSAFPETYVVPGQIQVGVAPVGTPEGSVQYSGSGTLNGSTGAFTGSASVSTPGAYTVYVKTCGGLQSALVCAVGSRDVTV